MAANPLIYDERVDIQITIGKNKTIPEIADGLTRSHNCIRDEIRRNGGRDHYRASTAQRRCDTQHERPKPTKLEADRRLAAHVAKRLKLKDSPMTISKQLEFGVWDLDATISHETIYQCLQAPNRGLDPGLYAICT